MASASTVGYGSIAAPVPRAAGSEGISATPATIGSASSAFARYQRSGSGKSNAGDAEESADQGDTTGTAGLRSSESAPPPPPTITDAITLSPATARPIPVRRSGSGLNNSGHGSAAGCGSNHHRSRSGQSGGAQSPLRTSPLSEPTPFGDQNPSCCRFCSICGTVTCSHSSSRFAMPLAPLLAVVIVAASLFWWASMGPDLVLHHGQKYDSSNKGSGVGPKRMQGLNESASSGETNIRVVGRKPPFMTVTRSSVELAADSEALWTLLDSSLFSPDTLLLNGNAATPKLAKPFPSGAFWTNLVINMKSANLPLSEAIISEPFAFKWGPHDGLQASYPSSRRTISQKVVKDYFYPDLTLSCAESISQRHIVDYNTLSVHLRFYTSASSSPIDASSAGKPKERQTKEKNHVDAYIVQGSPYITLSYNNVTPKLTALSTFKTVDCLTTAAADHGLCDAFVDSDSGMHGIRGVQFLLESQEGLTWLAFASEPFSLVLGDARRYLQGTSPYLGILRLALLPSGARLKPSMGPAALRLITHAPVYPISGQVVTEYHLAGGTASDADSSSKDANLAMSDLASKGGDVAVVKFVYESRSWNSIGGRAGAHGGSDLLLMMALSHHVKAMHETLLTPYSDDIPLVLTSSDKFDGSYLCIKGPMTAVVGNTWSYREPLGALSLDYDRTITNPAMVNFIKGKASRDVGYIIPTANDIYGFGKEAARMAQLVHISSALGDDAAMSTALAALGQSMDSFFRRTPLIDDALLYDADLGGVISSFGLADPQADFGNGRYNDHHFHYGYLLYASAILGRHNATFVSVHGAKVDALAYDIANEDPTTSYYPVARHKDFYGGHSWASGLFPQADGKSQESSSEAVNAYYGASLWSLVSKDTTLHNFARLLLTMEIRSAQTYWHTSPNSFIFNGTFAENYMVGNLGGLDATATTWFGNKQVYVHLINLLPITSVTEQLFNDSTYLEAQYKNILKPAFASTEMAWRGYLVCQHAMIDPAAAWKEAQTLVSYELDSALSLTQVLYFIGTRKPDLPQFNVTADDNDPSCAASNECAALNLEGDCCPSTNGVFLGCCS